MQRAFETTNLNRVAAALFKTPCDHQEIRNASSGRFLIEKAPHFEYIGRATFKLEEA
jgi:hypothetical protein